MTTTSSGARRVLFRFLRGTVLIYLGLLVLVTAFQRKLLFLPTVQTPADAEKDAVPLRLDAWRDMAGGLIGWKAGNAKAAKRLVVFHGNGGCAQDRTAYVDGFGTLGGGAEWEVFLFEYPGYGARPGSPGKSAIVAAGIAAVDALLAEDSRPLFLLGESLGSGAASAIIAEEQGKIAGAVMMIPFARIVEIASKRMGWLPLRLLMLDQFDNVAALNGYKGPVAFVIAEKDDVVGPEQGQLLYETYAGPKTRIVLSGATHNDFPNYEGAPWFRAVSDFLTFRPALETLPRAL